MNIDELFEFDDTNPRERLAEMLVASDENLIHSLVAHRKAMHIKAGDVAARMGIDKSGVSRIESGVRDLQLSTIRRYAMAVDAVIRHEVVCFNDVDGAHKALLYYNGERLNQSSDRDAGIEHVIKTSDKTAVVYG